jgi:hypothetical protein
LKLWIALAGACRCSRRTLFAAAGGRGRRPDLLSVPPGRAAILRRLAACAALAALLVRVTAPFCALRLAALASAPRFSSFCRLRRALLRAPRLPPVVRPLRPPPPPANRPRESRLYVRAILQPDLSP